MQILFGWINDRLQDAQSALVEFLEVFLGLRPPATGNAFEQIVYGISWGYADRIAVFVTVTLLFVALFKRGYFRNFIDAFVMLLFISVAGGFVFTLIGFARELEAWLIDKADWYEGKSTSADLLLVTINDVFLSVLGLVAVAAICFMIAAAFTLADLFSFMAKSLLLPAAALSPLANFFRKILGVFIAAIVVADIFGRPAAIFSLNVGEWAKDNWELGHSGLGSYLITAATTFMMAASIYFIAKLAYNAPTYIKGFVDSASRMSDDVRARLEPGQKVDARLAREEYSNAHPPMPIPVIPVQPDVALKDKLRNEAVNRTATVITTAIVAGTGTAGAAAAPAVDYVAGKLKK